MMFQRFYSAGMLAIVFACVSGATDAASIGGLNMSQPLQAENATPAVVNGTLEMKLSDDRTITVAPWAAHLPQQFGPQKISGSRRMNMAGPIDELSLTQLPDARPWLLIGSGTRAGTSLVGNWKLQLAGQQWSVSNGTGKKLLGSSGQAAKAVLIQDHGDRWCLTLMESRLPRAPQAGGATEGEARAMWVAHRLKRGRTQCGSK